MKQGDFDPIKVKLKQYERMARIMAEALQRLNELGQEPSSTIAGNALGEAMAVRLETGCGRDD